MPYGAGVVMQDNNTMEIDYLLFNPKENAFMGERLGFVRANRVRLFITLRSGR